MSNLLSFTMRSQRLSCLVIMTLACLAIGAGVLADVYKLSWARDWLAPMLVMLYLIALTTAFTVRSAPADTRGARVARWAKSAPWVVLAYAFINIEIGGDAPVAMRLFGLSWTMGAKGASMLLALGGIVVGATAVGWSWLEDRRTAAAAARAGNVSTQAPPPTGDSPIA